MTNELPVPPELQHLIEKREGKQRRASERREGDDRRESDQGPIGAIESVEDLLQLPLEDRRCAAERRQNSERRRSDRRITDVDSSGSDSPDE